MTQRVLQFKFMPLIVVIAAVLSVSITRARGAEPQTNPTSFKFTFGPGPEKPGCVRVAPGTVHTPERGYGFGRESAVEQVDRGASDAAFRGFCTSDRPFFFSVDVPEGNYNVAVTLGDPQAESVTTVKAEARRLMLEKVRTPAGKFVRRSFTVNVRNSRLASGESVRLKPDEQNHLDWDNQLTLEFSDAHPALCELEVTRADDPITVYIAGDSTVCDQGKEPWCAWGQMLPRFFKAGVSVANYAESGESARSFISERRLAKLLESIKPGDYLLIQFGHNDQKDKSPGAGAFTTYQRTLAQYLEAARKHGANPVLITSMNRRSFDADGKITNSLGDFPEAVRQLAKEQNVPLIDLNAMSKSLYEAWGDEKSVKAFVHYPANTFPGQVKELKDNTHFNPYGAYELARCVVEGIKAEKLGIGGMLSEDVPVFDPSRPDPVESWSLPRSPTTASAIPEGH